jgi:hypothetical protein
LDKEVAKINEARELSDQEKRQAYNEIGKLHELIEEMDKSIQNE